MRAGRGLALVVCQYRTIFYSTQRAFWPSSSYLRRYRATIHGGCEHGQEGLGRVQQVHSSLVQLSLSTIRMYTNSTLAKAGKRDDGMKSNSCGTRETKTAIRKRIGAALKSTEKSRIDTGSAAVAERLLATPQLEAAKVVSVYLSMPCEMGTLSIVSELFRRGKKVYIPKVMGAKSADMRMFPLQSEAEVSSFPLSKWHIPEPSKELVLSREDGVYAGDSDLIVVPGVAFDARCNRLGHGRGYYDCFFERVHRCNLEKGHPPPVKIGICFDEQVVDVVPTSSSDVPLDIVLTPTRIFTRDDRGTS